MKSQITNINYFGCKTWKKSLWEELTLIFWLDRKILGYFSLRNSWYVPIEKNESSSRRFFFSHVNPKLLMLEIWLKTVRSLMKDSNIIFFHILKRIRITVQWIENEGGLWTVVYSSLNQKETHRSQGKPFFFSFVKIKQGEAKVY